MSRKLIAPFVLALATVGASPSYADTLTTGDFANGFETVDINVTFPTVVPPVGPVVDPGSEAGGFSVTFGGSSFTAYCVDLFQSLGLNSTYTDYTAVSSSAFSFVNPNANVDLGKLFAEGNAVNTPVAQAAFQLAVWEIEYETSGKYALGSGNATFTNSADGVEALADSWLGALATTTGSVDLTVYVSPTTQDVIGTTPAVPEPSTYALLAAGLLTVAFVARRRPSKH